jgi:shikimate 5-dehydrogenase
VSLTVDEVASWPGRPLILFVGVNTSGSVAHAVFDQWAAELGQPWVLRSTDLLAVTPRDAFRKLVSGMCRNPAVHGALVTAHKLRLYRACAQDLDRRDWLTDITHEINAVATGATLAGYARDALSLGRILPALIRSTGAGTMHDLHVLCLGAGGAATALLLALHLDTGPDQDAGASPRPREDPPATVTFADVDPGALADLRSVADRAGIGMSRLSFLSVREPADNDALVAGLPSPALVINATGLGKDAPGSPVTDRARFGPATLAWDLNYRGDLTYLRQAAASGADTVDGWDYFVAGWAGGLTAIAETPFTADLLTGFALAAAPYHPQAVWRPG